MAAGSAMPQEQRAPRSRLGWAQAVLGAVLVGYAIVHLVQCWSLLGDPALFVLAAAERRESGDTQRAASFVLVLVGLQALLALLGARKRVAQPALPGARGLDLVQLTAGLLAAGFIVFHVVQVRVFEQGPHLGAWDGYGALLTALEQRSHFAVYVVGVTALCFYLAFGAARFSSGTPQGGRTQRIVFGALGLLLWALWLQPLARLATGAAMF